MKCQSNVTGTACLDPDLDKLIVAGKKRHNWGNGNADWMDDNMKCLSE